ncbi:HPP family [Teratosphaeria destructans]|uniref:HPP family n=1 Tax=Teratosphaeria destructans TaxID=418781 RepID=A0A9W7W001_9PEZI|nr:HPP family [Teratosphaeria destructans]
MKHETYEFLVNFNMDRYLNQYIPRSRLAQVPRPISWFLGYRKEPRAEPPALVQWVLTFLATVAGLCLVGGVFNHAHSLTKFHGPTFIASMGATAILDYNAIRAPLAQPRNAVIGHGLSAVVGVGIAKLFQLAPNDFFNQYQWVSGAVGCACASVVMSMTNTVHPPGGATAVLASTNPSIIPLGWWFVPMILLAATLQTIVACLFMNTFRSYPMWWWSADDTGAKLSWGSTKRQAMDDRKVDDSGLERQDSATDSERTLKRASDPHLESSEGKIAIEVKLDAIELPSHIDVSHGELAVLRNLQERLRVYAERGGFLL